MKQEHEPIRGSDVMPSRSTVRRNGRVWTNRKPIQAPQHQWRSIVANVCQPATISRGPDDETTARDAWCESLMIRPTSKFLASQIDSSTFSLSPVGILPDLWSCIYQLLNKNGPLVVIRGAQSPSSCSTPRNDPCPHWGSLGTGRQSHTTICNPHLWYNCPSFLWSWSIHRSPVLGIIDCQLVKGVIIRWFSLQLRAT